MVYRSVAPQWSAVLRQLMRGNQRYVDSAARGRPLDRPTADGGPPVAAVLVSPDSPVVPERMFDAPEGRLYVVQGDLSEPSTDLLAGLEWGVRCFRLSLAIVLAKQEVAEEIAIQTAPYGLHVVGASLQPDGVVRFHS